MVFSFKDKNAYIRGELKSIESVNKRFNIDKQRMRQELKILIIDDEGFPYSRQLHNVGFINSHLKLDIDNINDVEPYHFILCDITGVGKSIGTSEGFSVVSQIKKYYPQKYVYIYTGKDIPPAQYHLFKYADGQLPKSASLESISDVLDDCIEKTFNPMVQWKAYRQFLIANGLSIVDVAILEDETTRFISGNASFDQSLIDQIIGNISLNKMVKAFVFELGKLILLLTTN